MKAPNGRGKSSSRRRNNGFVIIVIVLMAIAAMFAAAFLLKPKALVIDCNVPAVPQNVQFREHSKKIQAKVYVDGTPSMNGFVAIEGSRYARALRSLNTAITGKWKEAQIQFYRFGDDRRDLLTPADFLNAQKPIFYPKTPEDVTANYPWFVNSQINNVVKADKPTNDSLILIVSDMTENNQNMRDVFESLKQKYINAGFAVGLFAQRSQFNGTVYDVGINNDSFDWNTNSPERKKSGDKSYRPFYILMLGRYANINYFYERLLESEADILESSKFVIFDNRVINSAISLDLQKSPSVNIGGIVSGINYKGAFTELTELESSKVQILRLFPNKSYNYIYKINQQAALPHTVASFARELEHSVEASKFDTSVKELVKNDAAKQFVEAKELKFNNQETEVEVKFNIDSYADGTYKFIVSSTLDKLPLLSWFKEWSSDESNKNDGARTFNVFQLLNGLHQLVVTANSDRPKNEKLMSKLCFVAEIH
jgi:hypothetical protein